MIKSFIIGTGLLCASAAGGVALSEMNSSSHTYKVARLSEPGAPSASAFVIPTLQTSRSDSVTASGQTGSAVQPIRASLGLVEQDEDIPAVQILDRIPPEQEKLLAPGTTVRVPPVARPIPAQVAVPRNIPESVAPVRSRAAGSAPVATLVTLPVQPATLALRSSDVTPEYLIGVYR